MTVYTIHDAPGFKLEVAVSYHPASGHTIEFYSTWPTANHPEPHRLLSLTLPGSSFHRLAKVLEKECPCTTTPSDRLTSRD